MQTPADVNLPPLCGNLALPCGTPRTLPDFGLATSGALYLRSGLALAGDASVFDNVWYSSLTKDGKEHNHVKSLLGGVRVALVPPAVGGGKATGVQIFGQVLAGTEWSSVQGAHSVVQPGGGIDARFPSGPTVRIQLDYARVAAGPRDLSGARVFVGMVYGFGSREP